MQRGNPCSRPRTKFAVHYIILLSLSFPPFACRMVNVQVVVFSCFAVVLLSVCVHSSQPGTQAPLCQPGILEEMPQHIKKVCQALENSDQLTSALKSYINNEASGESPVNYKIPNRDHAVVFIALVANSDDLLKNYNKRTDVDHVFLRFGKRR